MTDPSADSWHDPVSIRSVLFDGARRWGLDHPIESARIFSRWAELVGEQVAARCEPVSLSRGVLKVRAASAPWASELRYLAPEVIRRVNAGVGREVVRELKVMLPSAGGPTPPGRGRRSEPARGRQSTPARGREAPPAPPQPATTPAARQADAIVAGIADERLAEATKRALLAAQTRFRRAGGPG
jgi:hypothetical protein